MSARLKAHTQVGAILAELSDDDAAAIVLAFAELLGIDVTPHVTPTARSANAERQARFRDKHRARNVTEPANDNAISNADSNASGNTDRNVGGVRGGELDRVDQSLPSSPLTKQTELTDSPPVVPPIAENLREQEYQRAYERGISAGKGSPFAMPENQRGALHQGMLAHGQIGGHHFRGLELTAWIEQTAKSFAQWLAKRPAEEAHFWSSYGPRGWLRWLNEKPASANVDQQRAAAKAMRDFDQRYPKNGTGPPPNLLETLTKQIGTGGKP